MGLGLRPKRESNGSAPVPLVLEGTFARTHPVLVEWMSVAKWDDDVVRQTTTLSVFVEGGRWKLWVNDRDLNQGACVSADTLEAALDAVERGLVEGSLDWRPQRRRK